MLYEENPNDPRAADTFRGRVVWSLDHQAGRNGPEPIIRGLVEIPDRGLNVLLAIRRNTDQSRPASHWIELHFDTQRFARGPIQSVPGVRMKPAEQARGAPLLGASVQIRADTFLVGLTADPPHRDRNIELLRDRPWIDLPIAFRDGGRAVIAIEKGASGQQVFERAFAAWAQAASDTKAPAQSSR